MRRSAVVQDRSAIATRGIAVADIPDLINVDRLDLGSADAIEAWKAQKRDIYPHEEIFGDHCTITQFIECPVEMAFEYLANVYSLEEWSASLRQFEHVGGGLYRGRDLIASETYIYMRVAAYPECSAIDHLCAWDQGLELWMRYFLRLLDGQSTLGRPGTVLIWTNLRHRYYDRDAAAPPSIAGPRARADRPWIGELWDHFYTGHRVEAQNLKTILEYRFRAGKSA